MSQSDESRSFTRDDWSRSKSGASFRLDHETTPSGRGRRWRCAFNVIVVFATPLIDSIGFGIILPVTPDLLMSVSWRKRLASCCECMAAGS